jgi:hypothetical protein
MLCSIIKTMKIIVAGATAAVVARPAAAAQGALPDPIFAAIDLYRAKRAATKAVPGDRDDLLDVAIPEELYCLD